MGCADELLRLPGRATTARAAAAGQAPGSQLRRHLRHRRNLGSPARFSTRRAICKPTLHAPPAVRRWWTSRARAPDPRAMSEVAYLEPRQARADQARQPPGHPRRRPRRVPRAGLRGRHRARHHPPHRALGRGLLQLLPLQGGGDRRAGRRRRAALPPDPARRVPEGQRLRVLSARRDPRLLRVHRRRGRGLGQGADGATSPSPTRATPPRCWPCTRRCAPPSPT